MIVLFFHFKRRGRVAQLIYVLDDGGSLTLHLNPSAHPFDENANVNQPQSLTTRQREYV